MRNILKLSGLFGVLACGALPIFACSSTPDPAPTDSGADAPVVTDDAGPKVDSSKPDGARDAGPPPGPNCGAAVEVALNTESEQTFTSVGQSIYFKVPVKGGDFLIVTAGTEATDASERGDVVDTAINVYDTAGTKLLAAIDDSFPRAGTDATLIYRAPADTTICVQVTDFDTWSGKPAVLAKDSSFKFLTGTFDPNSTALNVDLEPNDTNATAQTGKTKAGTTPPSAFGFINGFLKDAADVDTFKFTVPAGATSLNLELPPIGAPLTPATSTYGSTMPRFTATVSKLDGTIVSQVVPPAGAMEKTPDSLSLPVEPGDYYLTIGRPAGVTAGANDFYATELFFGTGNPAEKETTQGTNDTLATAEALALTADPTVPKQTRAFLAGKLPAGDVADSFSFPVAAGDSISLACGAGRNGSGLQDFKVELFVNGASVQSDTETATADLFWSSATGVTTATKPAVVAAAAGTAVVQFSAATRSATNTGTYYLCGVRVTKP